jgi:hypothetical protein
MIDAESTSPSSNRELSRFLPQARKRPDRNSGSQAADKHLTHLSAGHPTVLYTALAQRKLFHESEALMNESGHFDQTTGDRPTAPPALPLQPALHGQRVVFLVGRVLGVRFERVTPQRWGCGAMCVVPPLLRVLMRFADQKLKCTAVLGACRRGRCQWQVREGREVWHSMV